MINRKLLQVKIWQAVSGYTLAQIESASYAQLATAANLTQEEIPVARQWAPLIRKRLITAKQEQLYETLRDGIVKTSLLNTITAMVEESGIERAVIKRQLSRMLDDLQEQL